MQMNLILMFFENTIFEHINFNMFENVHVLQNVFHQSEQTISNGDIKLSAVYIDRRAHIDGKFRWKVFFASGEQIRDFSDESFSGSLSFIFQQRLTTAAWKLALSNNVLVVNEVLNWISLRRLLGVYTVLYRSSTDLLSDMHSDYIKGALSEQIILIGIKLASPMFLHTPLASASSAEAKAKFFRNQF